jgi:hypothetical protein
MPAKCEVLLCGREATNFQNDESAGSHAYCDKHIETHGKIKMAGTDVMPEGPKKSVIHPSAVEAHAAEAAKAQATGKKQ